MIPMKKFYETPDIEALTVTLEDILLSSSIVINGGTKDIFDFDDEIA